MGNAEFLEKNYSVEEIERIEVRGSGETYNELISILEQTEIEYIESEDPNTYGIGAKMDVITSGLDFLLDEKDIEKLDIEDFLKN